MEKLKEFLETTKKQAVELSLVISPQGKIAEYQQTLQAEGFKQIEPRDLKTFEGQTLQGYILLSQSNQKEVELLVSQCPTGQVDLWQEANHEHLFINPIYNMWQVIILTEHDYIFNTDNTILEKSGLTFQE